jgi:general secretion pathway protein F
MRTATLDDFMALNDQLAALLQAGVPIDAGLGSGGQDALAQLREINASVARRVSQGVSLDTALEQDDAAPPAYRGLIQVGLRSGNLGAVLGGHSQLAQSARGAREAFWRGMLYPLIVCTLAYAGLVCLCLFFVPMLENLYRSLQIQSSWVLDILQALRGSLPVWAALPPAILLVVLVWRLLSKSVFGAEAAAAPTWLPAMSQVVFWQRCANFADSLATLAESGVPLEEGLPVAARAAGDLSLQAGAAELLGGTRLGQVQTAGSAGRFPPFLRWALLQPASSTDTPTSLRMAARWYREAARRRSDRIRIVTPLVACAVLGGGATLLYGLALFAPVVDLLWRLAS